jgi:hypothetical protein
VSSILDDVKHMLGLLPAEHAFDSDIINHINSVFSILNQIGVGPDEGFQITDNTTQWEVYIPSFRLNSIKSYMFLRVKNYFDPPDGRFVIGSMDRQIQELEWRILIEADNALPPPSSIIDGGSP